MDAVVVVGGILLIYLVDSDRAADYLERRLWFSSVLLFGLVTYMNRIPWVHTKEDFVCHGNISSSCLVECFNKTFHIPVVEMWYLLYFTSTSFFLLMEFCLTYTGHTLTSTLNFLFFHLFYFLFQGSIQWVFLCHLLFLELPLVRSESIQCSTYHCPGPYHYVIMGTAEKRMSIYNLMVQSSTLLLLCVGSFIYTIYNYLMDSRPNDNVRGG